MINRIVRGKARPFATVSLLAISTFLAAPAIAQEAAATGQGLEEIIVTAQKREQSLQDVPVAVSALSADALEVNRVGNLSDLSGLAPGLSIKVVAVGAGLPTMTLRGNYSVGAAPGSDKGVAIYIDGVYYGATTGSLSDIADIERIEVLRGPQGTLFGRNSTGGAISFTTSNPTGEFGIRQDFTYGNFNQLRSRTRIETPQFGPLSAVLSYVHSERSGDIRNLGAGAVLDFTSASRGKLGKVASPRRLGDRNSEGFAATVKLDISSGADLIYKYDYNTTDSTPFGIGVVALNPAAAGPGAPLVQAYTAIPNTTPIATKRPSAVNNVFSAQSKNRMFGHNLTLNWAISDAISIKNIAAFRKTVSETPANQLDGMGGAVVPSPVGLLPFFFIASSNASRDKQYSEELIVNYASELLDLTAGAVYFEQTVSRGGYGFGNQVHQFTAMPGYRVLDTNSLDISVKSQSYAAYAQSEIHATDAIDIVLGARITKDKRDVVDHSIPGAVFLYDYNKSKPTYTAGVNYKVNDDILTYAKFSTGYISGGQLARIEYKPETAKSWEAGIKADLFDRRLRANLAVFHVKYANMQLAMFGQRAALGVTDPVIAADVAKSPQALVSQGDARAWGFELETQAKPTDSLLLGANVSYTNFKFTHLNPLVALAGETRPTYRPEWVVNLNAQYETPEFGDGLSVMLRADANMESKYFGIPSTGNPIFTDISTIPTTWIVNGRASLRGFDLGGAGAEISAWVKNLTNNRNVTYLTGLNVMVSADYQRARTYGVDVSFSF